MPILTWDGNDGNDAHEIWWSLLVSEYPRVLSPQLEGLRGPPDMQGNSPLAQPLLHILSSTEYLWS